MRSAYPQNSSWYSGIWVPSHRCYRCYVSSHHQSYIKVNSEPFVTHFEGLVRMHSGEGEGRSEIIGVTRFLKSTSSGRDHPILPSCVFYTRNIIAGYLSPGGSLDYILLQDDRVGPVPPQFQENNIALFNGRCGNSFWG